MGDFAKVDGITTVFLDSDERETNRSTARFVRFSDYYYKVRFKLPEELNDALSFSKMLREAYNRGSQHRASEIRQSLGVSEEISDALSDFRS